MHSVAYRILARSVLCVSLIACGGGDEADDADTLAADTATTAEAAGSTTPASSAQPATGEASLAVADIDRWQRGMEAELAAVREAGDKLKQAKTSEDTLNATFGANEMATAAAGARGAGVDEERYKLIRSMLSPLAAGMAPLENEMDVSKMPADAVTALKAARDTGLMRIAGTYDPAVVDAMRPRAAALRKQELDLVAARLRAAGMVQ